MTLPKQTSKNLSGFYIGVGCPGCGGELTLDSEFFVVRCTHCGSVLRVKLPETPPAYLVAGKVSRREARFTIDRYLKENGLPLSGSDLQFKYLYYPYWKIDAVMLKVRNRVEQREYGLDENGNPQHTTEIEKTEVSLTPYSTTLPAGVDFEGMPAGIGVRSSYLKLVPFSRDNTQDGFDPLPVVTSWSEVYDQLLRRVNGLGQLDEAAFGINRTELYRPVASLVYFPCVVVESYDDGDFNRFVIDGVTGRLLEHTDRLEFSDDFAPTDLSTIEFGQLDVDFHRCPNCGEDLPPEPSVIYVCANCQEIVSLEPSTGTIRSIQAAVTEGDGNDQLFPFWSLQMAQEVHSRLQRLFGGLFRSDRLVLPAFRTGNFEAMFRLTKRMSTALPRIETTPVEQFDSRCRPVGVGLAEARLLAGIITYRAELDRLTGTLARNTDLDVTGADLVFAPFHPESYFYVDSIIGAVTFEKHLVG